MAKLIAGWNGVRSLPMKLSGDLKTNEVASYSTRYSPVASELHQSRSPSSKHVPHTLCITPLLNIEFVHLLF
ncbi:hypothetical protein CIHG_00505 [Coccidioides immitis H538.4]|uniref:Uncharacterized protein n=1 Tax=Coccidioides immitis H538.4 TaxID=396776 RepID=A0A0J8RFI0_COCIT|nr:hypothetical protein CIHG_00505 [Coccidioides immitis H538.4]